MRVSDLRSLGWVRGIGFNPYCLPTKIFKFPRVRRSPVLKEVITLCPGGSHAWVKSDVGTIRKHLGNIPLVLKKEYAERVNSFIDWLVDGAM